MMYRMTIEEMNLIDPHFHDVGDMDEMELMECFGTPEQLSEFNEEFAEGLREWTEMVEKDREECYLYTLEPSNNWAD